MPDTPHLALPLLASAQAQKHVTVNEALTRLDALTHLTVVSRSQSSPPLSPEEGERHIVPAAADGAWSGQTDQIAIFLNGGWVFAAPGYGWRAEILGENQSAAYDGLAWRPGALAITPTGAATAACILIYDHQITGGPTSDISAAIPDRSIVLGVTARVTTAITGAASWRLGVLQLRQPLRRRHWRRPAFRSAWDHLPTARILRRHRPPPDRRNRRVYWRGRPRRRPPAGPHPASHPLTPTSKESPMDSILTTLDAAFTAAPAALNAAATMIAAASAITAITPTPRDDRLIGKLYAMIDLLALNIGHAKETSKPRRRPARKAMAPGQTAPATRLVRKAAKPAAKTNAAVKAASKN